MRCSRSASAERQRQPRERGRRGAELGDRDRHAEASSAPAICAVGHAHQAAAALGELEIVGDEDQRRLPPPLQAEQQIDHLLAGLAVEIAGRLVGEDDLRARAERAGDGDALLLAARELRREMIGAMREADFAPAAPRADVEGIGLAGELQRQRDVLERRHGRHQMERLEDDADVGAAHERQLVLARGRRNRGRRRAPRPRWPARGRR